MPIPRSYTGSAVGCTRGALSLLTDMANQEHLEILAKGVEAWNEWRKSNPDIRPILREAMLWSARLIGADLRNADLVGARLHSADMTSADCSYADFAYADLVMAHMSEANLSYAGFHFANLQAADLTGANFEWAILGWANLTNAKLKNSNFRWTGLNFTVLGGLDLRSVRNIEYVIHGGPSSVGIDTLYRSRGEIPEIFLRRAGVPDNAITYSRSLVGKPFDFYSCFISYSTKDQDFADRLYADLQARGVRCWFASHDIQGGRKVHEQIDEAVRVYDKLLLILSDASMNSAWVKTEIANARVREQQQSRQMLFPISLVPFERIRSWKLSDADTGIDSAREIREYFIPDFSNWKDHDAYTAAFERLVRDLKAEPTAKQPR